MRAAPGAVPRAIAQLSRRIDIASNPSTAARVAKMNECRVNPGPYGRVSNRSRRMRQGLCRTRCLRLGYNQIGHRSLPFSCAWSLTRT